LSECELQTIAFWIQRPLLQKNALMKKVKGLRRQGMDVGVLLKDAMYGAEQGVPSGSRLL